jgi:hypothetical protein
LAVLGNVPGRFPTGLDSPVSSACYTNKSRVARSGMTENLIHEMNF